MKTAFHVCGMLVAVACSNANAASTPDAGFPAQAFMTVVGTAGKLRVDIRTTPDQPPSRGTVSAKFTVTDVLTRKPESGLTVDVVPWMPAMGHGASAKPTVTELGNGEYVATNVSFFMPGRWELRTSFSGHKSDRIAPVFDVP